MGVLIICRLTFSLHIEITCTPSPSTWMYLHYASLPVLHCISQQAALSWEFIFWYFHHGRQVDGFSEAMMRLKFGFEFFSCSCNKRSQMWHVTLCWQHPGCAVTGVICWKGCTLCSQMFRLSCQMWTHCSLDEHFHLTLHYSLLKMEGRVIITPTLISAGK